MERKKKIEAKKIETPTIDVAQIKLDVSQEKVSEIADEAIQQIRKKRDVHL